MKPRLLIVDDEPRMAEIVGMVLRREGYDVETFTSSAAAIERHEEDAFDLVLTDLRMPAPDGLEVLKRVRAATPDIPVILFTAHATIANAIEALRAGAFDYVQKPFDNDALRACVARALELSRLARENRYLRAELGQDGGAEGAGEECGQIQHTHACQRQGGLGAFAHMSLLKRYDRSELDSG